MTFFNLAKSNSKVKNNFKNFSCFTFSFYSLFDKTPFSQFLPRRSMHNVCFIISNQAVLKILPATEVKIKVSSNIHRHLKFFKGFENLAIHKHFLGSLPLLYYYIAV